TLWHEAFTQVGHVRQYFDVLLDDDIQRMPWNIRRSLDQVNTYCSTHFLHVASFLCRGVVVPDKALSFHAQAVSCFNKGQPAKGLQCGRAFQLGRIGGNFLLIAASTSIRMEDKASVRPMIAAHQDLFGAGVLTSSGMDKGYYSGANRKYLQSLEGLKECCLQQPGLAPCTLAESDAEPSTRLVHRGAGIEPLILQSAALARPEGAWPVVSNHRLSAGFSFSRRLSPPKAFEPTSFQLVVVQFIVDFYGDPSETPLGCVALDTTKGAPDGSWTT